MDNEDRKDIIKKVNTAGNGEDNEDDNSDNQDDTSDDFGDSDESGDDFGSDLDSNEPSDEEDLQEFSIYEGEMDNLFLEEPKRNNMFQEGSNDILDEGFGSILEETEDYVIYEVIEEGKKKKKKTKKDACYHKVKSRYDVWPSAYASGALVKCRKAGAKNWGNSTDETIESENKLVNEAVNNDVKKTDFSKEKESGLHGWFSRKGGEGSQGWVDCNTCRDGKCKPCGRKDGEERKKYPSCRPTPSACKTKGKGESWGKKSANESDLTIYENHEGESNNYMFWLNLKGIHDDATEILGMDCSAVDELIEGGHQWVLEHIITSKDDIEEVYHFLEYNLETNNMMEGDMGESNNYMFWSSLKTIAHASGELLKMDKTMVDEILSNGHGWALDHIATSNDDMEEVYHFLANTLGAYDGDNEDGYSDDYGTVEGGSLYEGKYDGKKLGKPMKGDVKKFKVYVKNKKGNVIKVNFGDPNMEIKRDNPKRKKSFRARHKCAQAKDRTTPKYWSCRMWSSTPVSKIVGEDLQESIKSSIFDENYLKMKIKETFNHDAEPMIQPQIRPEVVPSPDKVQPNIAPSRKNKPFLPMPEVTPDPKAMTEGKFDYEVYHKTLASCFDEAERYVITRGYDEIEFGLSDSQLVSYGQTERYNKELTVNGKLQRKAFAAQIYRMDSGNYELNMYIN